MILSREMWSVWFPVRFHVPLGIVGLIITIIIVETNDSHVTIKMPNVQDILCVLQVCHSIISALFTDLSGRGSKSLLKI